MVTVVVFLGLPLGLFGGGVEQGEDLVQGRPGELDDWGGGNICLFGAFGSSSFPSLTLGKSESDSKSYQPHLVSKNWISSPSVERKTDSCCSWVNFDFQRRADLDHTVFELEAKYDIHTSHCTRKSKSTRLVKKILDTFVC